jgi:hypothetical protein
VSSVDWFEWHDRYDDPNSRFVARLALVQRYLRAVLDQMPPGPITVVSVCAGQGRDILGVLRDHPRRDDAAVTLVEQDSRNAEFAREMARTGDLTAVTVVVGDAGDSTSYRGVGRASLVIIVGFLSHIGDEDVARLVGFLPQLCAVDGLVIWCRGSHYVDFPAHVRMLFARVRFVPLHVECAGDPRWNVGIERFEGTPRALETGVRLFTFRTSSTPHASRLRRRLAKIRGWIRRSFAAIRR